MTLLSGLILFFAALLGGALNSVAGGGSFITFPALFFSGVPPIQANATSTVALWPGSIASVSAYRREIAKQNRVLLLLLIGISLIGGILGAVLLLRTSQSTFVKLIPYLLLLATVLFVVSPYITARLHKRSPTTKEARISWIRLAGISLLQLIIAIYGGYFGGGIGIMMLASLGIMGIENIHEMNGLKTVLQSCINGVAVVTFIIAGAVYWPEAIVMIVGAIVGGFSGASIARKLDQRIVRGFVILVGTVMTIYFFVK
jgi:uncharacterized membrane protein YfcA